MGLRVVRVRAKNKEELINYMDDYCVDHRDRSKDFNDGDYEYPGKAVAAIRLKDGVFEALTDDKGCLEDVLNLNSVEALNEYFNSNYYQQWYVWKRKLKMHLEDDDAQKRYPREILNLAELLTYYNQAKDKPVDVLTTWLGDEWHGDTEGVCSADNWEDKDDGDQYLVLCDAPN